MGCSDGRTVDGKGQENHGFPVCKITIPLSKPVDAIKAINDNQILLGAKDEIEILEISTKIGYTERDVDARIKEQTQTVDVVAKKEWQDLAIFSDGKTRFTDKEFHSYLTKNDIKRRDPKPDAEGCTEWFYISGDESYILFGKFKRDKGVLESLGVIPYVLRKEQKDAVKQTKDYFLDNSHKAECLWNAKPRFGKTLSTYDLCKALPDINKILIVTNRPAIANSWYDDYVKFMGTESGYYFVSNVDGLKNKKYVFC